MSQLIGSITHFRKGALFVATNIAQRRVKIKSETGIKKSKNLKKIFIARVSLCFWLMIFRITEDIGL